MKNIAFHKKIGGIAPVCTVRAIRPVCVPDIPDTEFADGIRERFSRSIYSLWQRLGLIFFAENKAAHPVTVSENVVNNFSSRIIFRFFSDKRVRRAVNMSSSPQNVFITVADRHRLADKTVYGAAVRSIAAKSLIISELGSIFRLLNGRTGSSYNTSVNSLRVALTRFLRESKDNEELTGTEMFLLNKLEQLLKRSVAREQTELLRRLMYIRETEKNSSVMKRRLLAAVSDYAQTRDNIMREIAADYYIRIKTGGTVSARTEREIRNAVADIPLDLPVPNGSVRPARAENFYFGNTHFENRIFLRQINSRSNLISSPRISSFIQRLYKSERSDISFGAVNSRVVFRTAEPGRDMVMLIPPAQTDRYMTDIGSYRRPPPMELRQHQAADMPQNTRKKQSLNVRSEPTVVTSALNTEKMSREELTRLADKVYSQIETRLLRERRRIGL